MKQCTTKEQYLELDYEQAKIFEEYFVKNKSWQKNMIDGFITIGQMIEFLGDDFDEIRLIENSWHVCLTDNICQAYNELCDALWEAVKYKFKQ